MDAMTQGRAREAQERENGHDHIARHRLRGAAARRRRILLPSQGVSRTRGYARTPLPRTVADLGGIGARTRRESTIDTSFHGSFWAHSRSSREIATHPRGAV